MGLDATGRDRFERRRVLGAGGMGTVYEALDRVTGEVVALKVLTNLGPLELYLFKNEFRSLADMVHPNLVGLRALFNVDTEWFFSMDLIRGAPFLSWVWGKETWEALCGEAAVTSLVPTRLGRGSDPAAPPQQGEPSTTLDRGCSSTVVGSRAAELLQQKARSTVAVPEMDHVKGPAVAGLPGPEGLERLRSALPQLVAGVAALHRAGKLHRDLKPSNVLVTPAGRVVLLDFGLVQDISPTPDGLQGHLISGTVPYMSPEQARGERLDEASDWYALGAMLYEALTGRVPHEGRLSEVLVAKTRVRPPSPAELNPGLPGDLVAFCMDLLQVDPALRPTGDELMERLGLDPESSRYEATGTGFGIGLIGRHGELARLRTALEEVRRGRAATLQIRGRSGMGKTALVEEFLEEVRDRGGLVLTGRCFERESVPYKALDPLVDALARHLLSLPAPERDRLLPADLGLLARVFRVVERLTGPVPPAVELGDPLEQRRRAFAALRDLLDQVARQQLLVLHLDDLQWSDGDSLGRLRELLRPPAPPPLLLLLGLRSEPEDERPLVREFLEAEVSAPPLEIGPLSPEEAGEMAARLLKAESPGDRARAAAIAREAEGVPIFLEEMVRYLRMAAVERLPTAEAARLTLEEVIGHRVGVLPAASRDLLEIVAVAGQPLPQRVAWDAAGIRGQGWRALAVLSAQRLVRTHGRDQGDPVECFHDRIRTTLVGSMAPPRLRERHLALAQALDAGGDGDPERLLLHYLEGGDRGRAAIHARTAADQAYRAFAFDRAADLYRRCAELQPEGEPVRLGLDLRLADSLEKAGRGPEAAEAFLAAASVRPPEEGWRLVGRAATICLLSGHLQQGKALLRQVLQDLGIRVPGSTAALLLSLAGLRLRLRLRGTAFRERAEETLPREILDRVDACWGAALGFGLADPVEGLVYQNQALLMALEAGEPRRVARTLSMEAAFLVVGGGVRGLGRAEAYFATAEHIADRLEDQALQGALAMARAVAMLQVGRWRRSRDAARVALDHLGHAPSESAWDLITARIYDLAAAGFLGDLRGALELYHEILRTARERGDLHSLSHVRLGMEINAHLIAGDPAAAREDVEEAISQWVGPGFTLQHFYAERALCQIDLFDGRFADAARRALLLWTRVQRSTVRSVGFCRGLALDILGRTLVAPGVEAIPRVQRIAARLEREGPLWTRAHAVMLRSQAARARGDGPGAAVLLRQAVQRYEDADMAVHAGAARWRLAELTDASRIATEREALAARGAADPEGLVRMLAPAGDVTGPSRGGDGSRGAAVP